MLDHPRRSTDIITARDFQRVGHVYQQMPS
jgi:hypothetical protein